MRMLRRASACSMIEKSFAPVKKKLMYAMTSINVILISTIPIASRKRWLITISRVERKKYLTPVFSTVIGFCFASKVEDEVGLVTLLAIIKDLS